MDDQVASNNQHTDVVALDHQPPEKQYELHRMQLKMGPHGALADDGWEPYAIEQSDAGPVVLYRREITAPARSAPVTEHKE